MAALMSVRKIVFMPATPPLALPVYATQRSILKKTRSPL
jgi:hypothetical protein